LGQYIIDTFNSFATGSYGYFKVQFFFKMVGSDIRKVFRISKFSPENDRKSSPAQMVSMEAKQDEQ
jgi:hypothetical protein